MILSQSVVVLGRFVPKTKRKQWIAISGTRRVFRAVAFMPYSARDSGNPEEVSTYQIQDKSADEVVRLSERVGVLQPLEGYGELQASKVESQIVCLIYDDVPKDHVGIRCWETLGQDQRLAVAAFLAEAATYFPVEV